MNKLVGDSVESSHTRTMGNPHPSFTVPENIPNHITVGKEGTGANADDFGDQCPAYAFRLSPLFAALSLILNFLT
jgi:hypothetical protein